MGLDDSDRIHVAGFLKEGNETSLLIKEKSGNFLCS
jgi:hypothetical protein